MHLGSLPYKVGACSTSLSITVNAMLSVNTVFIQVSSLAAGPVSAASRQYCFETDTCHCHRDVAQHMLASNTMKSQSLTSNTGSKMTLSLIMQILLLESGPMSQIEYVRDGSCNTCLLYSICMYIGRLCKLISSMHQGYNICRCPDKLSTVCHTNSWKADPVLRSNQGYYCCVIRHCRSE